MSAGFSDLLSTLGIWLGGRKSSGPPTSDVPALVTEVTAPLNIAELALRHNVTENLSDFNTSKATLRSNVTETLAPLNVTTQETAVLR